MKIKYFTYAISATAILLCSIFQISLHAQSLDDENVKIMSRMDTESFKGKIVLNKAMVFEHQLQSFRKREKDKEGVYWMHLETGEMQQLINVAERGDMDEKKKPEAIDRIQKRTRDEITGSNVIPIGIINLDAILLTEEQVQENIKTKSEGKKADASRYESVELIAAGLLQDEIFQGDVQFKLSTELLYSNNKDQIRAVSIDFLDGKGWQSYPLKDNELISHRFTSVGEVGLYLRLETERGVYITSSTLKIRMLDRIKANITENITAQVKENGRVAETLGAQIAVYNGCDGVFNKPIIIAEGFDVNQNNNLNDMVARFFPYLYTFPDHGYDLVFVNYDNGQAAIQDNAQVLKAVINEIKGRIQLTDSIIFIGQSMSGLIGRWALREMENANQPHKVKLFIAFDSGQQGSYTPPGLVAMSRALPFLGGLAGPIIPYLMDEVRAIDSPASKQLLMYHDNISRHPDFNTLRQNLTNMGNGGYPALSRNIAIINGSVTNTRQKKVDNINEIVPGEILLDLRALTFLSGGGYVNVWGNRPGEHHTLMKSFVSHIFSSPRTVEFSANLPYNFDRVPGGYVYRDPIRNFAVRNPVSPKFTHMPVFSSIDYRGPLNSDADHSFSVAGTITNPLNQVINPSLTPFKAIYGENFNSRHTFPEDNQAAWNTLAIRELGINPLYSSCMLQYPPAVKEARQMTRSNWHYLTLPGGVCKYSSRTDYLNLYLGGANYWYTQFIRITGPGNYSAELQLDAFGRAIWNYHALSPGTYIISAVRRLGPGNERIISSTFQIGSNCRVGAGCPNDDENGNVVAFLTDTNEPCFGVKINGVWVAVLGDGTFVSRERLVANGVSNDDANCFAATDPQGSAPASTCPDLGNITYQRWENIGGGSTIDDLIIGTDAFQNTPAVTQNLNIFEAPANAADNYGARMRGYICPPTTGQYTFWVASDDASQLWLSTDENPDNSEITALVDGHTSPRDWSAQQTQRSFPVTLQAGQKYYIEARMKDGLFGDHLSVGWQLPNGALERPIPGNRLVPFSGSNPVNCSFNVSAGNSSNGSSLSPNQAFQLNYTCLGSDCGGVSFSWSGNGASGNAQNYNINAPNTNGQYTYTMTATKAGCGTQSPTTSITVGSGGGSFNQCVEAESSSGNGAITSDPNASNGQTRGEQNNYNHYVDYAISNVPSAGTYTVTLRYYSSADPVVSVLVNGGSAQTVNLANSLSWNIVPTTQTFNVTLNQGSNTIRIQGTGGGSCRQDRICVDGGGSQCTQPAAPSMNPTSASISSGNNTSLSASCSGGASLSWSHGLGTGGTVSVSPTSTTTYTATCTLNGCSNSANVTVTVNNPPGGDCYELRLASNGRRVTNVGGIVKVKFPPASGNNQTWKLEPDGSHYKIIVQDGTSRVLGVESGGNSIGNIITLQNFNGQDHQLWTKQQISDGGPLDRYGFVRKNSSLIIHSEPNWGNGDTLNSVTDLKLTSGSDLNVYGRNKFYTDTKTCPTLRMGVEEAALENIPGGLTVLPNPNAGEFEAGFYLGVGKAATLSVINILGQTLYERGITGQGTHTEKVKLGSYVPGIFLVQLRSGKSVEVKKIIVVR